MNEYNTAYIQITNACNENMAMRDAIQQWHYMDANCEYKRKMWRENQMLIVTFHWFCDCLTLSAEVYGKKWLVNIQNIYLHTTEISLNSSLPFGWKCSTAAAHTHIFIFNAVRRRNHRPYSPKMLLQKLVFRNQCGNAMPALHVIIFIHLACVFTKCGWAAHEARASVLNYRIFRFRMTADD